MNVGLLQLHNTADIANNKQRLAEGIIDLAHRGAELIVLQELHNSLYFCQVEDVDLFDLAEPIPGLRPISTASLPRISALSSSPPSSSAALRASTTIQR